MLYPSNASAAVILTSGLRSSIGGFANTIASRYQPSDCLIREPLRAKRGEAEAAPATPNTLMSAPEAGELSPFWYAPPGMIPGAMGTDEGCGPVVAGTT